MIASTSSGVGPDPASPRWQDRVEAALDQLADSDQAMFAVAVDGEIVAWNRFATELLGIPGAQALGWPCWLILSGRDPAGGVVCREDCEVLARARAGRSPGPAEVVMARRRVAIHHLTVRDGDGQPAVVVHLLDDVAGSRSAEGLGQRARDLVGAGSAAPAGLGSLTGREGQVLRLICRGLPAREVAAELGISHATARTHIQRVLSKLGARNRVSALAAALLAPE